MTSSAFLALINLSVLFASSRRLECWCVSDEQCFALCAGVLILLLETTLALFGLRGYESWPGYGAFRLVDITAGSGVAAFCLISFLQ